MLSNNITPQIAASVPFEIAIPINLIVGSSTENNNKIVMDFHTANALSTETNTKKFNEKYGVLLEKINMYMQVAIEQGNYECHVPVAKEDNKPKEIINYLEGKRYIVNYIEFPSDKLYNDLRIYWGDH